MKYLVEYQFTDTLEIISKEFEDFIQAMRYQGEVLKKYGKRPEEEMPDFFYED